MSFIAEPKLPSKTNQFVLVSSRSRSYLDLWARLEWHDGESHWPIPRDLAGWFAHRFTDHVNGRLESFVFSGDVTRTSYDLIGPSFSFPCIVSIVSVNGADQ